MYIHHILFIHSSVDGHLVYCHVLATVNDAPMNIDVHVSFQISIFVFFEFISRSGIAGSYSSSNFSLLRNLYTLFPQWLHQSNSHQQCMTVPFSLCPHQYLVSIFFLIIAILTDVRWYLSVALICISLMIVMLSILSCSCWPPACPLWRNVHSVLLLSLSPFFFFLPIF